MATASINGSALGGGLAALLTAPDIKPGDAPSYELCKQLYAYHPLGSKMVDAPIQVAQSQGREISIPNGPEERLKEAFEREWKALGSDKHIANLGRLARMYGVSSIALMIEDLVSTDATPYDTLWERPISFNVFDPLNTSGSLVLNQIPTAMDFQKVAGISVQGQSYNRSRTVTLLNEEPIYIEYTTSAFGYVGRSVFQRALYMLKSYIQTLVTDDLISLKAGVLIAKMEQPGSVIDNLMAQFAGQKRGIIKEAATGNVISVGKDDDIESLDLHNLDGAYALARKNILENIATAASMPAKMLNQETFAEGFGEGTEDAKQVAQFVDGIRNWLGPAYEFFTKIVQHRAWNPKFYQTIQNDFPSYKDVTYDRAFYDWVNNFEAHWPSLLTEPESERIKVDDVKLKAIIAMVQVLGPDLDPENKARLYEWATDNFNALKLLFSSPLILDLDDLREYQPAATAEGEPSAPAPFSAHDSIEQLSAAVARLPVRQRISHAGRG